jgi:hypothetical protein
MQAPVSRPGQRRAEEPRGRRTECAALDQLAEDIRAGESRTLVICGEPGIGKTALLEYPASRVPDCQVLSGAGAESESELSFDALHQVCSLC